ncbi:leucine-rich repeat extensin-like protein 3 [Ricinus communis]|uniref:leucine-rich repeat extensin-like protein 3 n=1 Tax=Ricinus communis TaxID=3988 RepID=UPI00201A6FA8|nr:leucine-rich repeat extensin-like protein 3 [Ricinus communis]
MDPKSYLRKLSIIVTISSIFHFNEARLFPDQVLKRPKVLESVEQVEPTNGKPYGLPSPLYLPPLASPVPVPAPAGSPLSSVAPPPIESMLPPFPPSTNISIQSPPKSPPKNSASPPMYNTPIPSPPQYMLSPPKLVPSPPGPVVQTPPSTPPPPHKKPQFAVWCVAKPTVPDSIVQEALDYACGSGADCKSIQPNGPCFQPNTLVSHASYAFNSYWQKAKAAGGTCDFGGTAMLVTNDPGFDNCNFTDN